MLSIGGCGGDSCFRASTRIATRRGVIPIELIRVGMKVLSYDLVLRRVVERSVTRLFTHAPRWGGQLAALGGVTPNHPVFDAVSGRFKQAGDFRGGERLLRLSGETTPVSSNAFAYDESAPEPVYNFSVEETETYFADGVLVHNKSYCFSDCYPSVSQSTGGTPPHGSGGVGTGGAALMVPPEPECEGGGQAGTPMMCLGGLGGMGGVAGMGGKQ